MCGAECEYGSRLSRTSARAAVLTCALVEWE